MADSSLIVRQADKKALPVATLVYQNIPPDLRKYTVPCSHFVKLSKLMLLRREDRQVPLSPPVPTAFAGNGSFDMRRCLGCWSIVKDSLLFFFNMA